MADDELTKDLISAISSLTEAVQDSNITKSGGRDGSLARNNPNSNTNINSTIRRIGTSLNTVFSQINAMATESVAARDLINEEKSALKELAEEAKRSGRPEDKEAVAELQAQITKLELNKIANEFRSLSAIVQTVTKELDRLIVVIRQTQQTFGITAGQSVELEVKNLFASARSYIESVATLGATSGVSRREVMGAQQSMQAEFGGIISSKDATELARQAKDLGVTTQQLAQARRAFMTQTMGDVNRAASEQDRFVTVFQQKGLTSKDAMEAIAKNGELLARAGTRFSDSFAKAAVESKKIGVELSKVNQVGDNIIGNFEGFLESQAELGAMGFGFDTSRLAEIAESGDTGALMDELRSQLAMTGKDLGSLRRSEQLALSQAFGLDMGELQRLAGKTPEQTEQQKSNEFLDRLVNLVEGFSKVFTTITALLGVIAASAAARSIGSFVKGLPSLGLGGGGAAGAATKTPLIPRALGAIARSLGAIARSRAGKFIMAPTRTAAKLGTKAVTKLGTGGIIAGVVGGASGFMQARKKGKDVAGAAGAGAVQGGSAAIGAAGGAALGTLLGGPGVGTAIGAVVGGFVGDAVGKGLNKFAPEIGANVGALFKGIFAPIKAVFEPIKPAIDRLKEAFSGIFEIFSGPGREISEAGKKLMPVMEFIGKVIGTMLTPAFILLSITIQSIINAITLFINVGKLIIAMIKLDGPAIKNAAGQLFKGIWEGILGAIKTIPGGDWLVSKLSGLGSVEGRAERRASSDAARQERQSNSFSARREASRAAEVSPTQVAADDMVSKPGYGQRTLVTPNNVVALNDQDNVVAYADDMVSQNAGLELLSKGAISREMDNTKVNVDMTALERKMDQMIAAITNMREISMDVKMDADLVGRAIVKSSERSMQSAVFRPMDV
jgi:hypothetical protein